MFTSSSEIVCTSERLARNAEGKAVGLDTVTTVLEEVSVVFGQLEIVSLYFLGHAPTFAICTADSAGQDDILFAGTTIKKVSTVRAEDKRSDCRHCG